MSKLRKPFYHVDEVLARWEMTERDITAFVLADELTLSATVAGLRIQYGSFDDLGEGNFNRLPEGYRYIIGTVDLARDDAWRILREGSLSIGSLKCGPGEFQKIDDTVLGDQFLVHREDVVVCRAEIERFEGSHGISREDAAPFRRGAPQRFDWDSFWVEICRIVHDDGIPRTQSELVGRMCEWFDVHNSASPDESTIKKKLKPLWHAIRPEAPAPSLSRAR